MLIDAADLVPIDAATCERNAVRIARSVRLSIAGMPCCVNFGDAAAAEAFAARYADLEGSARVPEREAFAVHDDVLGPLFWSPGGTAYRWPHGPLPPDGTAFFADAVALTAFLTDRHDGIVSLHAAAVGTAAGGAAIVADSNVGKTTTALACARTGLHLYSDERCLVDRSGRIHAFPRAVNVRDGGRQLLLHDVLAEADVLAQRLRTHADAADWQDVRFADLFGGWRPPPPVPLRTVFLISGVAAEPRLERVRVIDAVKAAARWAIGAGSAVGADIGEERRVEPEPVTQSLVLILGRFRPQMTCEPVAATPRARLQNRQKLAVETGVVGHYDLVGFDEVVECRHDRRGWRRSEHHLRREEVDGGCARRDRAIGPDQRRELVERFAGLESNRGHFDDLGPFFRLESARLNVHDNVSRVGQGIRTGKVARGNFRVLNFSHYVSFWLRHRRSGIYALRI
jgi:hypothetical protein